MVYFDRVLLPLPEEACYLGIRYCLPKKKIKRGFNVKSNGTIADVKSKEVYLFMQSLSKVFTSTLQACLMQYVHFEIKYTKRQFF